MADDLAIAQHHKKLLGEALGRVLVAAGIVRSDAVLSGPELLLAADDYVRYVEDRDAVSSHDRPT